MSINKKNVRKALFNVEQELGSSLPVSFLVLLLSVPTDGAIHVTELRKRTSLSEAGTSRALSMMTQHRKDKGRIVPKFLEMYDDPEDRRYRLVELTQNGKRFVDTLLHLID